MQTEYIDITPTWEDVLPILVEVAARGESSKARKEAMDELRRMARIADKAVAATKEATQSA